jgi:hypothetical protein
MKRTFEILNPKVGIKIKDRNEKILGTIQAEIFVKPLVFTATKDVSAVLSIVNRR